MTLRHRVTGKIVVITGASSGIGRAAALRFARQRASLVLAARSQRSLDEVAEECRTAGADVLAVRTDVADAAAIDSLVSAATSRFGRIDVWVGAASVYGYGTIEAMPPHVFRRITPIYQHAANYTGERVHPLPPVASPERVANAILQLATRPKPVTVIGWTQRVMIPVHSALPALYSRMVVPVMNRFALRRGEVPATSGTVFDPDPQSNRVHGGWRSPGWRTVVITGLAIAALSRLPSRRA